MGTIAYQSVTIDNPRQELTQLCEIMFDKADIDECWDTALESTRNENTSPSQHEGLYRYYQGISVNRLGYSWAGARTKFANEISDLQHGDFYLRGSDTCRIEEDDCQKITQTGRGYNEELDTLDDFSNLLGLLIFLQEQVRAENDESCIITVATFTAADILGVCDVYTAHTLLTAPFALNSRGINENAWTMAADHYGLEMSTCE